MSLLVSKVKEQIKESVLSAFSSSVEKGQLQNAELPDFTIEIPANRDHGDFAVNAALVWARALKCAPRAIADAIKENIDLSKTYIKDIEIAGPGFINMRLNDGFYADVVLDVLQKGEDYGNSDYGKGKRVLVEFVSANPTGPMHIGNARGGALGDCLAAVLSKAGFYTEREFYVNDAGNQINKFGLSLDLRYRELFEDGIEMPEDSYHGEDIIKHAKDFAAIHGDKYMKTDEATRREALVSFALPKNIEGLKEDLKKYRIEYDTWFKESTLHKNGEAKRIIELLKKSGYTYESEGALWFRATDFNCDKDFVLIRANGVPTYIVPDIAYHYNKLAVRNFDKAIDILGADHHGYVPRLKATLTALGLMPTALTPCLCKWYVLSETAKL